MFVWTLPAIRSAIRQHLPESAKLLAPVGQAVKDGKDYSKLLADIYPRLQKISIDYAVMEKAKRVLMVELSCEWLDIGSWPALEQVLDLDEAGNVVVAPNCVVLDSARNVIVSEDDHLLAIVGMDDCIVVRSRDATLVCNKSDSQRLKELVDMIEQKYGKKYT
jgi:mannose-1-phosphate guanylyltransferase